MPGGCHQIGLDEGHFEGRFGSLQEVVVAGMTKVDKRLFTDFDTK